jgi:L-threonylcarbamoyladenylate synthase
MAFVEEAVATAELAEEAHRSPGLHRKHYSPRTRVLLVKQGRLPDYGRGAYLWIECEVSAARAVRMPRQPEAYAKQLYGQLHEFDREGFDWIAVEMPPETREWAAIRDRLTRAAY